MSYQKRDWLRSLRKQAGLTCQALGEEIGVSKVTVLQWEQGVKSPSHDNLLALAGKLGPAIWTYLQAEVEALFPPGDAKQGAA